jgi:hypothetical protein
MTEIKEKAGSRRTERRLEINKRWEEVWVHDYIEFKISYRNYFILEG